jgi:Tfp pilus assembly protein PilO
MKKLIYRKHLTTFALVWSGCFVLLFLIYMLMLAPQQRSKRQSDKELAEKRQVYETAVKAAQERTKRKLNEQIERLQYSLKEFAIDSKDSANLIFDIRQIATDKEVGSFEIEPKDTRGVLRKSDLKHISESQIDISFTAGFNQFAALLNALERYRPVVFVDKFKITRSKDVESGHKVDMGLAVFVRKRQDS